LTPRHYDRRLYKERNLVERFFHRLKQFRRIATSHDKLVRSFLAFIFLARPLVWLLEYQRALSPSTATINKSAKDGVTLCALPVDVSGRQRWGHAPGSETASMLEDWPKEDCSPNCSPRTKKAAIRGQHFSSNSLNLVGRGGRIRTCDPLRPRQVRYQTALRPDNSRHSMRRKFGLEVVGRDGFEPSTNSLKGNCSTN
jgi:hypothetical protein